jgi:hypothetical protein
MKHHALTSALAVTLLGSLFHSGPARAAQPFNGTLEANVTITPLDPPFASVLLEGSVLTTGLGPLTFTAPHLVNFATATGDGEFLFTAANGDTLLADFSGSATPTAANPNNFDIVEFATITGGTGRFAGATGSFTVERFFDTTALTTVGTFQGTLVPEPSSLLLVVLACAAAVLVKVSRKRR